MLISQKKTKQRGATLVEVLVAMVVMSLGILGFSALQITGLSSNKVAMDRSHASILAYSIADAMRANRTAAIAENYDRALGDAVPTGTSTAETDISNWLTEIAARLPSGDGSIDVSAVTGEVTITIAWDESKSGAPSNSFSVRSRL
ncbi:type IV pilus modification protein PilV [Uliginosibacterium sp. 31-16]|uniref:type IV pilus modification protein PilV n=1 Tax=Uliginosibacterium sp. 31-16 TaxID=3068315 RepID=UPI00273F2AEA|nr:type IV pilus modification protein PilV [Uliginosibacterium sp. 31-16]MDP5240135.1 type IV pilus modification protein PilV [Uliginosibacterium sp. 31-16]